ncbi:MAG: PIN domain-containing protein [Chloroflexota bacterium]|nr:PIN domain-containing protein [Chloroflexota bacterium]MDE3102066.1 PIN domain-containing protein [Chloroflexota bacterium]
MIFTDTSFWVALHDRRDDRHEGAVKLLREHDGGQLVISDHVQGETWTTLRARAGQRAAVGFLDAVASSERVRVVFVSEALETQAFEWLRAHGERPYSFVDATSFALMRSLGVGRALTFDSDFAVAGFVIAS